MTIPGHDQQLIRNAPDLPDEAWGQPSRGRVTWPTLFSAEATGTRSLSTGVATVPVGQALAVHRHRPVETYFILRGSGVMTLADKDEPVEEGTSILIPSGVRHGVRNTGSGVLEFFYAFATDSFGDVVYDFGE